MLQKWVLVAQSHVRINGLKEHARMDKDQIATYTKEISNWIKQVEELHRKIKKSQQKKYEIENSKQASVEEKMIKKANINLLYTKSTYMLDEEVQTLKFEGSMNDKKSDLQRNVLKRLRLTFHFKFSISYPSFV